MPALQRVAASCLLHPPLKGVFLCAGWNMNPEDAAAFAAAQQMAAAEAAREAPGVGPGAGIDADLNG